MNNSILIFKLATILEEENIKIENIKIEKEDKFISIIIGGRICQMNDFYSENIEDKR